MHSSFFISALFCLLAGQAMSIPLGVPTPMARALEQREPIAIEPVNAYVQRQNIPIEEPVKAPNAVIEPYKRDLGTPIKALNGVIEPYKRDDTRQDVPVKDTGLGASSIANHSPDLAGHAIA
ncbi:hypothetical protein P691DRAFT_778681 [Macrolepiota fuliginosa MF-IS2]|uniref:Uncharacterized protein n=1 Tax=Macrolepiota fuliginosa MF-IS2 TaxID=1400762 RepID=A0A9P6BZU9_9AGAR|nr:hypothetical protein P691DRAFT_778681 [Macrolepiota fuliginosa MF-IS2]